MKPMSKESGGRSKAERTSPVERRTEGAAAGDRRATDNRHLGAAMVDALEDILQWERASERAMKVADSSDKLSN